MPRPAGKANRVRSRTPAARDRVWHSMRQLRRFTLPELVATAEAGRDNAQKYVLGLLASGFIRCVRPRESGRKGGHAVYQLVRNTGPHAPRLQSDGRTYDPNTHQIHDGGLRQ